MPSSAAALRAFASPLSRALAREAGLDLEGVQGSGPQGRVVKADVLAALARRGTSSPRAANSPATKAHHGAQQPARHFSSPAARAMAREAGLDLATLAGTGPLGRVVRADVQAAVVAKGARGAKGAKDARGTGSTAHPEVAGSFQETPYSFGRKLMARRLSESKQRAPHFYARIDCELDAVLQLRAAEQPRAAREGLHLSLNDFLLHAVVQALRAVPALNATVTDGSVRQYGSVHIAMAVAVEGGLLTPVLRYAEHHGVAQIAREARALATQARTGGLPPGASGGGTFSVSNLGAQGVREFAAVINPPQAGILALGAAEQRAVVRDGQLAVATVMTATLSVDHRAIDGVVAAQWLAAFRTAVQNPSPEQVWAQGPGEGG